MRAIDIANFFIDYNSHCVDETITQFQAFNRMAENKFCQYVISADKLLFFNQYKNSCICFK